MRKTIVRLLESVKGLSPNKGMAVLTLLFAGYAVGLAVLWTRYLEPVLPAWAGRIGAYLGLIALFVPMALLWSFGQKHYLSGRNRTEHARAPADYTWTELWRGKKGLGIGFWIIWFPASAILAAGGSQALTYYLMSSAPDRPIITAWVAFGVGAGAYFVSAVGAWRLVGKHSGSRAWVVLVRTGVIASGLLVASATILGATGWNVFQK